MQVVSQSTAVAPFTESYILGVAANQPNPLRLSDRRRFLRTSVRIHFLQRRVMVVPGLQPLALNA